MCWRLDTFKDIWEPPVMTMMLPFMHESLDTFKDIWELVPISVSGLAAYSRLDTFKDIWELRLNSFLLLDHDRV